MSMIEWLFLLCVGVTAGLGAMGFHALRQRRQPGGSPEVAERLSSLMGGEGMVAIEANVTLEQAPESLRWPQVQALADQVRPWQRLDRFVRGSGKKVTAAEMVALSLALVAAGAALASMLQLPVWGVVPLLAVLGGFPWWRVARLRAERVARFEGQFPDALDLIGRAMRAGHSFPSAVRLCGDEMPLPIGPEFRKFADEINYGVSFTDAVNQFALRVPVNEVSYFVVAVLIQRETGGNLIDILDKISVLVRQRIRLMGEIRAITAQGRLSANIMTGLPLVFCLLVYQVHPDLVSFLWTDPVGVGIAWLAVTLLVVGVVWVRQIVKVRL